MIKIAVAVVLTAVATAALAQSHQPYTGMEQRAVKALSEQQIADLKAGRGMGLALPAELNGYPGPMHVLEHSAALALTAEQRQQTEALFQSMKAEAVPIGERLIEQETRLDRLFADRNMGKGELNNGFYVDFGKMVPGAGWLAVGPGYRKWFGRDAILVDGSAGYSWNSYRTAQVRLVLPKVAKSRPWPMRSTP